VIKNPLPTKYSKYEPAGGFGQDLIALATAVIDLQEQRHLADYDPLSRADIGRGFSHHNEPYRVSQV
jgi:hypothetical protein